MSILDTTTTPKYGLANLGSAPKTSGYFSGLTVPNQTQTQNSGLMQGGQSIQTPVSQGTNTGQPLAINQTPPNPHTNTVTTKNGTNTTVVKPTPNPSVLAQQQSLNQQNRNTLGYIPLVEDGLAGPKTSAALAQYGYNTQTGQKNTTTSTNTGNTGSTGNTGTTSGMLPDNNSTQTNNSQVNSSTGVNANGSTTPGVYTPSNQGTTGVSQGGLIGNLVDKSNTPSQAYTDAQANANAINKQIEDAKAQMAKQTSDINQSGTWTSRALGEQGQANIQNAATLAALGSQYQGATNQIANANTQQGLQVTAGTNAASANAPITGVPYGTQTINPSNIGGTSGGGQVQPNDPFYATLQQAAQQAANGQYSAIPSSITGNAQLNAQMNTMAKAINPNYNPVTSSAQSGITAQQTQQQQGYQSALQQGQNLAAQATDLINTFGLNPSEINKANGAIQIIASNTSNPQYKMLNNYLADISSRYAQILTPAGGSNTDTTRAVASGMLDNLASGKSLQTVLNGLDQQAQAVISGVPTPYGGSSTSSGGTSGAPTWDNFKI